MTIPPAAEPLVLTLRVDEQTQQAWDELRRRWFPAERLMVGAHLTLFHALPGRHQATVVAELRAMTPKRYPVRVTGLRSLGHGVALAVESAELDQLHAELRRRWRPWLTAQDDRPLRAHVTVQNKVEPATARAALAELGENFRPWTATATGIEVWRYLGGPWVPVAAVAFPP